MKIYIIIGCCGIPTQEVKWIVDAWTLQFKANERVEQLEKLQAEFYGDVSRLSHYDLFRRGQSVKEAIRASVNGDPNYETDVFTSTSYFTEEVDLKDLE